MRERAASPPAAGREGWSGLAALDALAGNGFSRVAEASEVGGNAVRLLRDGTENFPRWLAAIEQAEHSVHLENYILADDGLGRRFAAALQAAAGRGVRCRVIYDWMGCRRRAAAGFWSALRERGVEVRCYNPPSLANPLGWISRDHRKLLCVDGQVAFTGGLCIAEDWIGDPARDQPPWRDTAVEIRGPAVAHLEAAFADSWAATGPALPALAPAPGGEIAGGLDLWVIPGRPDTMGLYRLGQLVADIVQSRLWLSDAYFVATTGYARALAGAARAGVDVRLLVPGITNIPLVGSLSRAGYHGLLDAGVRVFEWNGPMMHAKTAVADGRWARVGSSNSNLASWISNRELDVAIHDPGFAAEMEAMFEQDLANATEIVLAGRYARPRVDAGVPSRDQRRRTGSAGRLLAGAVGVGSAVSATLAQHRDVGPTEQPSLLLGAASLVVLAALGFAFPVLLAYPLALAAAWVASTLLARAWRQRTLHRGGPR